MTPFRILTAAALLLSAQTAFAAEGCPPAPPKCTPDEYDMSRPGGLCPPDSNGDTTERVCQPIEQAPGAIIDCTRTFTGYACKGWPRGAGITHQWSATPPMSVQGAANLSTATIRCNGTRGSTIALTVTSPVGLSSSTSVSVSCGTTILQ